MPSCCVPKCPMGLGTRKRSEVKIDGRTPTLIQIPEMDNEQLEIWRKNIKRDDLIIKPKIHHICDLHFAPDEKLIRPVFSTLENTKIQRKNTKKTHVVKLKKSAIPTVFNEYPAYLRPKVTQKRSLPKKILDLPPVARKRRRKQVVINVENEAFVEEESNADPVIEASQTTATVNVSEPEKIQNNIVDYLIKNDITQIKFDPKITYGTEVSELSNNEKQEEKTDHNNLNNNENGEEKTENITNLNKNDKDELTSDVSSKYFDYLYNVTKLEGEYASWIKYNDPNENFVSLTKFDLNGAPGKVTLKIYPNLRPEIIINGHKKACLSELPSLIFNNKNLNQTLLQIDKKQICQDHGTNIQCEYFTENNRRKRCSTCQAKLKVERNKATRAKKAEESKKRKQTKSKRKSDKFYRLQKENKRLKEYVKECEEKCSKISEEVLENKIKSLPNANTQETVRQCFKSATAKGPSGQRYSSNSFVYNCILLKIKSPTTYRFLRNEEILPLPSETSIRTYCKNIKSDYGFDSKTFELIKEKVLEIDPRECRGNIMIDELKLSEGVKLDSNSLEVRGFVNLGSHTPESQKDQLGDHGLVIMYQSYLGGWVQVLGTFLSKGCCPGLILHSLVLEALFLCESNGLFVDGVVSDNATWNHKMWNHFGVGDTIGINVANACEHPCDSNRNLFFFGDFPHIIKTMRNNLCERKVFKTPFGEVRLQFWLDLTSYDEDLDTDMKLCPRLNNNKVLCKSSLDKMKVSWAFQFYSKSAAVGMQTLKDENVMDFKNAGPTIKFCSYINQLADVMNNNKIFLDKSLYPGSASEKIIKEFLLFLEEWRQLNLKSKTNYLSDPTSLALFVTLKSTLQLSDTLCRQNDFNYVLTRRLNQDALENFFSLVRGFCGHCSHPNAVHFAQIVKLLSIYSLIRPLKGSNCTGADLVHTLLQSNGEISTQDKNKEQEAKMFSKLDDILENVEEMENIEDLLVENNYTTKEKVHHFIVSYMSGYVVRKHDKFIHNCPECCADLISNTPKDSDKFVLLKENEPGKLIYSGHRIDNLIKTLEAQIKLYNENNGLTNDYLFKLLDYMEENNAKLIEVGCELHKSSLTKRIIKFYLVTRLHFLCRNVIKIKEAKAKQKKHNKIVKFN